MGLETGFEPRKVRMFDGYSGESVWKESGDGTYYDYYADTQCRVPARSLEEIVKELEAKWSVKFGEREYANNVKQKTLHK